MSVARISVQTLPALTPVHCLVCRRGPRAAVPFASQVTGQAAIIDSGGAPEPFVAAAEALGLEVTELLQTHAHIDHVSGLKATKELLPAAALRLHPDDSQVYAEAEQWAAMFGVPLEGPLPAIDADLVDGEPVRVGDIELVPVHTPGHCPGHCVLVCSEHQFVAGGDLLFQGSVGRTDLPLCDPEAMEASLRRLYAVPGLGPDCLVLPGHGESTTLGAERATNGYVKAWVVGGGGGGGAGACN